MFKHVVYTLDEAASRLQISEEDVNAHILQGRLHPCFLVSRADSAACLASISVPSWPHEVKLSGADIETAKRATGDGEWSIRVPRNFYARMSAYHFDLILSRYQNDNDTPLVFSSVSPEPFEPFYTPDLTIRGEFFAEVTFGALRISAHEVQRFISERDGLSLRENDSDNEQNGRQKKKWEKEADAILELIQELGYDPKSLPKNSPGKPGVKSQIRACLMNKMSDLFKTPKIFNNSWEVIRQQGQIADSGEPQ